MNITDINIIDIKNTRKVKGAYVWYKDEIKRILVERDGLLGIEVEAKDNPNLNLVIFLPKHKLQLVKIGDEVTYKKRVVDSKMLPSRCEYGKRIITYMRTNDLIGTDKDSYHDATNFVYFEKWKWIENVQGITIRELKKMINKLPDKDVETGEDNMIWIHDGDENRIGLSHPATRILPFTKGNIIIDFKYRG